MIAIIGARGKISDIEVVINKINSIAEVYELTIQLLDAKMVYGRLHLVSAVNHAQRAFERVENISTTLAMEILLYAASEYQIKSALLKMGVKAGDEAQQIAVVIVSEKDRELSEIIANLLSELGLVQDDSVLEGDIEVLKRFGVSELEIAAVHPDKIGDLILERVAMVDIKKK